MGVCSCLSVDKAKQKKEREISKKRGEKKGTNGKGDGDASHPLDLLRLGDM